MWPRSTPSAPRRSPAPRPDVLAVIAAGGAAGACARYGLSRLVGHPETGMPWATLWANVSGCLVLGFVMVLFIERFPATRYLRPFAATGFIGSYTTFSTFAVEADSLVKHGRVGLAVTYVVLSIVAGLLATWLGAVAARLVPAARRVPSIGGERR